MMELKPCPFCGGEAKDDIYIRDGRMVACTSCGASVRAFNPIANRQAIKAWNTRNTIEVPAEPTEEMIEAGVDAWMNDGARRSANIGSQILAAYKAMIHARGK